MPDHAIQKPSLFISHAATDAEFAAALQSEIEKIFANGVTVFCTSSPGALNPGTDWLSTIEEKLKTAQAIIVMVTPTSIERPWVWFEVGASWHRSRDGYCRIYPLCAPEIDVGSLPPPLDRLQALSMGKAIDLKLLFEGLARQFGFGNVSSFRASNIQKRIPKYRTVQLKTVDQEARTFYSGRYSGYADAELIEVIDARLFAPDRTMYPYGEREGKIFQGKLLHFREVDKQLDLPPGTAKRLLNSAASRYGYKPALETENVVRYKDPRITP